MRRTLHLYIEEKQYEDMIRRYHFWERDLVRLREMGRMTQEASSSEVYFEVSEDGKRVPVIVTLGSGVDKLQERYMERVRMTESYMIECVAMELLENAYGQIAECIYACTGMWMSGIDFLGDKIPLGSMEEIFQRLKPQRIMYNQAYMLTPRKTVVFFTDLCMECRDGYRNVCTDCGNISCINRRAVTSAPSL